MSDEPKKPNPTDDATKPEGGKEPSEGKPEEKPIEAAGGEADEAEEKNEGDEDAFRPEAIAKRIETIGGEDEIERVAREEEQKLAARKKELKKKGKKGLESAAAKRLAKIGEKSVKRPVTAVPSEVDALRRRTDSVGAWMRANSKVFGVLVALAVLGAGGFAFYSHAQKKKLDEASSLLAAGVAAQAAHVNPNPSKDEESRRMDVLPSFKSEAERRDAALAKYREVTKRFPGSGPAVFAQLYEAELLLEQGKADDAVKGFQDVRQTALAKADAEVLGRATEGLGFAYELQADLDPSKKDKALADAQEAFKQMQTVSLKGMKETAQYHQARVAEKLGDTAKAKDLLTEVMTATKADPLKPEENSFPYLSEAAADRLRLLGNRDILPRKERQEKAQQALIQKQQQEELQKRIQELTKHQPQTPPAPSGSGSAAPPAPPPPPAPSSSSEKAP